MKKLEYKVAWIDDQPSQLLGFETRLREKLSRQGLVLNVEWITSRDQLSSFLEKIRTQDIYDLIMVDMKLGQMTDQGETGERIAKKIRNQNSYSNIIFYSASDIIELRRLIASQLIDGVWCVNRDYFVAEVWLVIETTLKKYNLNTIRGLYMDVVADFDYLIKESLAKTYNQASIAEKKDMNVWLINRKINYFESLIQQFKNIDHSKQLKEVCKELNAGSNDLFSLLKYFNSKIDALDALHQKVSEQLDSYEDDILKTRNDLAHAVSKVDTNGIMTLERSGRSYSTTSFAELRNKLGDHNQNLELLRDKYLPLICKKLLDSATQEIPPMG